VRTGIKLDNLCRLKNIITSFFIYS